MENAKAKTEVVTKETNTQDDVVNTQASTLNSFKIITNTFL